MKLVKEKYYRKVEQMLKDYPNIKEELDNTTEISAVSYKEGSRGKYGRGSATERIAIEEIKKEYLISKLDAAIDQLDDVSKKIIRYYYIDNADITIREIAMLTGYEERHVKRIKSNAIQKIACTMYGSNVIDVKGIEKKLRGIL